MTTRCSQWGVCLSFSLEPQSHHVITHVFVSCFGSLKYIFHYLPPLPKTVCFRNTIYTLHDSFIGFIPRINLFLFSLSICGILIRLVQREPSCVLFEECVWLLWQHLFGRVSPQRFDFSFFETGLYVCALLHMGVYIRAAKLIKNNLHPLIDCCNVENC